MVCLMVGEVVEREVEKSAIPTTANPTVQPTNNSSRAVLLRNSIYKEEANATFPSRQDLLDEKKLEVAVALSMLVGLFQVSFNSNICKGVSFLWSDPTEELVVS